jgi:hypothetical protein
MKRFGLRCKEEKSAGSGTFRRRGRDDVRTYGQGRTPRQRAPIVRLIREIWRFFQRAGEDVTIPVWETQGRSVAAA